MKLSRVAGILVLTLALTPGCTWDQSLMAKSAPGPSPPQIAPVEPSALESKLDAMDNRLERIEQMLTDMRDQEQQRQRQEEQSRQSLAGLRQEARDTQAALTRLQKQLATQHAAVVARLGETPANQVDFRAVDIPMGQLPNGGQDYEARRIPAQVPDKAREILVYAQVATGYVKAGPHRFRIAVRVEGAREAAFYLYAVGQPQPSWAYNSDNVWLPMPRDRQLLLRAEGEAFFGDWNSEVRIIAYR
ncbi:MAG TPA: hypothetical protein P5102_01570 [Candidatus Competibacteraceae bacterium]|nr:hypothetical protein [Candidatus Competibacteraceae bacterium]HRZ04833.1 hypothetical protein [Candidatus Competibacteraceae bacterium]HSA46896.1 hypothetical protein [Candidatus Competibacteraceae bacterium]